MSASARFAPMTAQLLARKGEAYPVDQLAAMNMDRRDVVHEVQAPRPAPAQSIDRREALREVLMTKSAPVITQSVAKEKFSTPSAAPRRRHSIALSVTDSEFEKLGLAAVKKRVNKQQLLRQAVDFYLDKLEQEYRAGCHCLSPGAQCCSSSE